MEAARPTSRLRFLTDVPGTKEERRSISTPGEVSNPSLKTLTIPVLIFWPAGILIESTKPTWMYATGFEHNVLYQYFVLGAKDLFMGLIQTETPYFQSAPPAPEPFDKSVGLFSGDPTFSTCDRGVGNGCMAWGLMIEKY